MAFYLINYADIGWHWWNPRYEPSLIVGAQARLRIMAEEGKTVYLYLHTSNKNALKELWEVAQEVGLQSLSSESPLDFQMIEKLAEEENDDCVLIGWSIEFINLATIMDLRRVDCAEFLIGEFDE